MNNFSVEQKTVLALLRTSIWGSKETFSEEIDWAAVETIAKAQAVIPLVYNGAVVAMARLPEELSAKWKKATVYGVVKNERLLTAQDQLIMCFQSNKISSVILKGSSVSRYYPAPDLRILGDIDVLVAKEDLKKAMAIISELGYVMREAEHDFHYGFFRKDAYLELHYNVTTLPDSIAGARVEEITQHFLKEVLQVPLGHHIFNVLTEVNQALSLLLHMVRHMYESGIGLRQICDWMMFVSNTEADTFQSRVLPVLKYCGLQQYAMAATAICVKYLGLSAQQVPWCIVDDDLADAFLEYVFSGGNMGRAEGNAFSSLFTDARKMGTKQSSYKAIIANLNVISAQNFPNASKYNLLRPFIWVFLMLRYWARSMLGKRKKVVVGTVIENAKKHRDLYTQLDPFGVDE